MINQSQAHRLYIRCPKQRLGHCYILVWRASERVFADPMISSRQNFQLHEMCALGLESWQYFVSTRLVFTQLTDDWNIPSGILKVRDRSTWKVRGVLYACWFSLSSHFSVVRHMCYGTCMLIVCCGYWIELKITTFLIVAKYQKFGSHRQLSYVGVRIMQISHVVDLQIFQWNRTSFQWLMLINWSRCICL